MKDSEPDPGKSNPNKATIVALFFDNRYLLVLAMVVTLVAGLSAVTSLPRLEDPVITNRNPLIITVFPGASADRVEALVTEKIEDELDEIDDIKKIDSTSRAGISIVGIELLDAVTKDDLDAISSEIRDKISDAADQFPREVLPPDFDDKRNAVAYTLIKALRWNDSSRGAEDLGILSRRADELADQLRSIGGTELVRIYGQPVEEVEVLVAPEKLAETGLTPRDVATALQRADVKVPAGQLRGRSSSLLVEVEGKIDSVDRVREVIVLQDNLRTIRVGDLATVSRSWRDPAFQMGYTEGQRSIFVAARIAENQRVDTWDIKAKAVVDDFIESSGSAVRVDTIFRQSDYTTARLAELVGNLVLGGLVVMVVIFFTMGWRRSLIVSSAIPLTAAATLFVISLQGGKLHQMSIFGMIIALGLLIDTAIVITDEIRKFLEQGLSRREAVIAGLRHLFVPLLSSTLTSVLAFMPILLLPGGAGDFVGSIGGSVIIAISASFLLSITVIAALAGIFSAKKSDQGRKYRTPQWMREGLTISRLTVSMRKLIRVSVQYPVVGILLGVAIPVLGFYFASTLSSQFFPRTDRDMFTIEITSETVTSIEESASLSREVEKHVRTHEGVEKVHWLAGASFPPVYYNLIENQDNSPGYVMGVVDADTFETVARLVPLLQEELNLAFPSARIQVTKFAQGPPANADVEIRIVGPSIQQLQQLGDEVQRRLAEHPEIVHAESTLTRGEPKLWFRPDEKAVRAAGIDLSSVADQLQTSLEGLIGGTMLEAVEELPVRVRVPDATRSEINSVEDLRIIGANGAMIPLRAIGTFELKPETGAITRRNGERANYVRGYAAAGALAIDITNDILSSLDEDGFQLPTGYRLQIGGESENQADAVGNLLLYLPVIVTVTIAILILSFKSVRMALILLASAFLSVGFGLFATWFMGFPLSFNTILGCIGLVGLAFNDNIVALAAIHANPEARKGDVDAIVEEVLGCGRHLISTTLTTIGSFLPLLVLIGGQFWPPLAIVLAGGVGGATFLAAVFSPAAYRLIAARKYQEKVKAEAPDQILKPATAVS